MEEFGKVMKPHLTHIIKGMGINSKHYKDRDMLTPEEGGDISNYEGYEEAEENDEE